MLGFFKIFKSLSEGGSSQGVSCSFGMHKLLTIPHVVVLALTGNASLDQVIGVLLASNLRNPLEYIEFLVSTI